MVENSKAEIIAPAFPSTEALTRSLGALSRGEPHEPFYGESEDIVRFEQEVARLYGMETAIALSMGMGAVSAAVAITCKEKIDSLIQQGLPMKKWGVFHFIVGQPEELYYHSGVLFSEPGQPYGEVARLFRIETTAVDPLDLDQIRQAKRDNTIGMFLETTANSFRLPVAPRLSEYEEVLGTDVKILADISLNPLRQIGQEVENKDNLLLVASASKDLSVGQLMGGIVAGPGWLNRHRRMVRVLGQPMTPDRPTSVLPEGVKSLGERFKTVSQNALIFARKLEKYHCQHPGIVKGVSYPGLPSHPQYEFIQKEMGGLGGGVLFADFWTYKRAKAFVDMVEKATASLGEKEHKAVIATSFGTEKTRLFPEAVVHPERPGLVRVSAGSTPIGEEQKETIETFFEKLGRIMAKAKDRHLRLLAKE